MAKEPGDPTRVPGGLAPDQLGEDRLARLLGRPVPRRDFLKLAAAVYLVAAVGCAVAGSVIYMNMLRIQPTAAFSVEWTARMIFIVIIGGLGSIEGPIMGTVAYIVLRELLGDFGSAYLIILGAIAIGTVLFAPRGLWGLFSARWSITFFGVQRRLIAGASPPTTAHPIPGPTEPRP